MVSGKSKKGLKKTKHECMLDAIRLKRELPMVSPFAPFSTRLCYYLIKWTYPSHHNPNSKVFFRSSYALYKERGRHLSNETYRFIIHPLSRFAVLREVIMCLLWLATLIIDPLCGAFGSCFIHESFEVTLGDHLQLVINVILLFDVVLQFSIGYTIDRTKEIVLDRKSICRHYINTFFFFDFVPAAYTIVLFVTKTMLPLLPSPTTYVWMSMAQAYHLRYVRIYTMAVYFGNFLSFIKLHESIAKCITIGLVVAIVANWWACFFYLVPSIAYYLGSPADDSWTIRATVATSRATIEIYLESLLTAVCHFFGAGKANMNTSNPIEQIVLALILMCGLTCHIYVIAIILQLFGTINISETKYEEMIYQLNEYMVTKKLPVVLRKRLIMYYEYRFQKQFFLENLILNSLSEHLRYEVILYSCQNLISKLKVFQGASKEVIGALVSLLKQEIYLPNDIVFAGEAGSESIYFISFGTVAVYLDNGKEIYHLEDGQHFGEVTVVLSDIPELYRPAIIAVEITEVFYLTRSDFQFVVDMHPEIAECMEKSGQFKLGLYLMKHQESDQSMVDTNDIITELRKGHILYKGRKRL